MIERYLFRALQSGLQLFQETPGLYTSLFGQLFGLSEREVDSIRQGMKRQPPKILHAYAPEAASAPCYVIEVNTENQVQSMLANTAGMVTPAGGSAGAQPLFTNLWRHQYSIKCVAQQRDKVEYLYEMAKCSICLQLLYLVRNNLDQVQLSGGPLRDLMIEPERLYVRELTFSCVREFRFYSPQNPPLLRAVDGLFIIDNRPNGGVDARLSVIADRTLPTTP